MHKAHMTPCTTDKMYPNSSSLGLGESAGLLSWYSVIFVLWLSWILREESPSMGYRNSGWMVKHIPTEHTHIANIFDTLRWSSFIILWIIMPLARHTVIVVQWKLASEIKVTAMKYINAVVFWTMIVGIDQEMNSRGMIGRRLEISRIMIVPTHDIETRATFNSKSGMLLSRSWKDQG